MVEDQVPGVPLVMWGWTGPLPGVETALENRDCEAFM